MIIIEFQFLKFIIITNKQSTVINGKLVIYGIHAKMQHVTIFPKIKLMNGNGLDLSQEVYFGYLLFLCVSIVVLKKEDKIKLIED